MQALRLLHCLNRPNATILIPAVYRWAVPHASRMRSVDSPLYILTLPRVTQTGLSRTGGGFYSQFNADTAAVDFLMVFVIVRCAFSFVRRTHTAMCKRVECHYFLCALYVRAVFPFTPPTAAWNADGNATRLSKIFKFMAIGMDRPSCLCFGPLQRLYHDTSNKGRQYGLKNDGDHRSGPTPACPLASTITKQLPSGHEAVQVMPAGKASTWYAKLSAGPAPRVPTIAVPDQRRSPPNSPLRPDATPVVPAFSARMVLCLVKLQACSSYLFTVFLLNILSAPGQKTSGLHGLRPSRCWRTLSRSSSST